MAGSRGVAAVLCASRLVTATGRGRAEAERNRRKVCAKRLRSLSWEKRFQPACEEHATRGSFDICRYYDSSRHFVLKIASRPRQFVAARWHTDCSSFKQRGRHVACFNVSDSKNVRRSRPNSTARLLKICAFRKSSGVVTVKYIRFFIFLLLLVISGCSSALQNSETFYRDHPPGPIRWHEYED
jgi:hypothetical protein